MGTPDDKKPAKQPAGDKHPVRTGLLVAGAVGALVAGSVPPHCSKPKTPAPKETSPQSNPPESKPRQRDRNPNKARYAGGRPTEEWQDRVTPDDEGRSRS